MCQFKKLIFTVIAMLIFINQANASLKESSKPAKVIIYLEDTPPFSAFNSQDEAKGMLVNYWTEWSNVTDIEVEFKPYTHQKLNNILNINNLLNSKYPAIYNGLHLSEDERVKLDSTILTGLSSEFYFLPKNSKSLKSSLIEKSTPIVVGGLLPAANRLPLINNNSNIVYKEYAGMLGLLIDLYLGDIDTFILFNTPNSSASLVEQSLPYVLSHTEFNSNSNELNIYSGLKHKYLLDWVEWGRDNQQVKDKLSPLLAEVTAPMWGVSELTGRYLLLALLVLLIAILTRRFKNATDKQFNELLESSPYPLIICSLNGKTLYHTNDEAKSIFSFKKSKRNQVFKEDGNQDLLSDFFNKASHHSVIESSVIRLLVGIQFFDIEISAKRIYHRRDSAWLCYLKNVTELLQVQRNLSEERALFRTVLDSLPEQIHFKSIKGEIIDCNDVWAKANNTTVAKAKGLNESKIQNKERLEKEHLKESAVWAGETINSEEWVEQKNKRMSLMNITKIPLHDKKGVVFSILSIADEITVIHNLNEKLKDESLQRQETEKALSKQNLLLKSIFDSTKDPLGLLDEEGVILGANRPFNHFMGVDLYDIVGASQKDILPYERADWSERQNKEVIQLGKSIVFEEFVFFEGQEIWYEVHKTPFSDDNSNSRGIVVVAKDITSQKNTELKLTNETSQLEQQSLNDQLTKVPNRRAFDDKIEDYWQVATEDETPLSVVIGNIDLFKSYNDEYGHQKGDETLQRIASIFESKCKEHDCFVARYDGKEFALLIPEKSATKALRVAESIREAVELERIEHPTSSISSFVTISMGMATQMPSDGSNSKGLIKEAGIALDEAKAKGRNQVQVT